MTSDAEPLVRARHLQEWLANVAREDDPWRARFFAALPVDMRVTIESASRVSWLPVRFHIVLADVLLDTFGEARAHDYYRRAFASSLRGPVFDSLVRTCVRLLGVTPAAFLRWADRGWATSFKSCGGLTGEVLGPSRGKLIYHSLPAICTASDAWLDAAQGSAYGVYDLLEVAGVVRIDKEGRDEGRMELELEWTERI